MIEADIPGLVANGTDADSSPFVLAGASHPQDPDALAALGRAIARADGVVATQLGADLVTGGEAPYLSPRPPRSSPRRPSRA